jgi:hypothetical protein
MYNVYTKCATRLAGPRYVMGSRLNSTHASYLILITVIIIMIIIKHLMDK